MQPERNRQNGVVTLWQGIAAWYRRDAIYRELAALDERALKDIGITRGDIPAVVTGRFRRSEDVTPPSPAGRGNEGEGASNPLPLSDALTPALSRGERGVS